MGLQKVGLSSLHQKDIRNRVRPNVTYVNGTSKQKNALVAKINKVQQGSNKFYGLSFEVAKEDVRRLSQAYVAWVNRVGDAYITQKKVTYRRLVWG